MSKIHPSPTSDKQLAAIECRARELEALGAQCDADEKALQSVDEAYKLYGIRSFPVADCLARFDIPTLVAEVRRLRAVLLDFCKDYDCDTDAHRHGRAESSCRCCKAEAALGRVGP